MNKEQLLLSLSFTLALLSAGSAVTAAPASDWGYEEPPKPVELKAGEAGLLNSLKPKTKPGQKAPLTKPLTAQPAKAIPSTEAPSEPATPAAKKTTPATAKAPLIKGKVAAGPVATDWVELLDLTSTTPLVDDQKSRFKAQIQSDLQSGQSDFGSTILQFWPLVKKRVAQGEEQKLAMAQMFRALLRFEMRAKKFNQGDTDMLNEALGPERIAQKGDPALTEEAVDAYGDMACFLYEQKHPGKSVDAYDNRAVFAEVIYGKFRDAPSIHDKRAMSNFALTWSKFKVTWLSAADEDKQQLLACIQNSRPIPKEISDQLVETIFHIGPWSKVVLPPVKEQPRNKDDDQYERTTENQDNSGAGDEPGSKNGSRQTELQAAQDALRKVKDSMKATLDSMGGGAAQSTGKNDTAVESAENGEAAEPAGQLQQMPSNKSNDF